MYLKIWNNKQKSNKEIINNKNTKKNLNFNIDEKIIKNDIDKDILNYQSNGEETKIIK